jgi:hypothetical protein
MRYINKNVIRKLKHTEIQNVIKKYERKKRKKYIKTVSQVNKFNKITNSFTRGPVINSRKVLKQRKKENKRV